MFFLEIRSLKSISSKAARISKNQFSPKNTNESFQNGHTLWQNENRRHFIFTVCYCLYPSVICITSKFVSKEYNFRSKNVFIHFRGTVSQYTLHPKHSLPCTKWIYWYNTQKALENETPMTVAIFGIRLLIFVEN